MRFPSSVVIATSAALALLVAAPGAAVAAEVRGGGVPVLTSPTAGQTVRTVRPKFRWTLPSEDYDLGGIQVARTAGENQHGYFPNPAYSQELSDGTTTATVPAAASLWAGRWFWHIIGANGETQADSGTRSFVIPLKVITPILSGRKSRQGLESFTVRGNMNSRSYRLEVAVYNGSHRCISRTFAGLLPRQLIGVTTKYASGTCTENRLLPPGTRIRLVATAVSGSVRRTATKTWFA